VKPLIKYLVSIVVFLTIVSCTSDVNFNQSKNIEINQNFSSTFVHLNLDQNKFLNDDSNAELPTLTDLSVIDIFKSKYFEDNLVRANFTFEIQNTFDRSFIIELSFLNVDDNITNSFNIIVPNNSNITHLESFEDLSLLSLKFAEKLKMTFQLQPSSNSSMLTKDANMNLRLKSYANFIFKLN